MLGKLLIFLFLFGNWPILLNLIFSWFSKKPAISFASNCFLYTIHLFLFLPYCFDFNFQGSVYKNNRVDILLLFWLNRNASIFYISKNDMDYWLESVFFMLRMCFLIFEFTKWFFSCSFCFVLKSRMGFKWYEMSLCVYKMIV